MTLTSKYTVNSIAARAGDLIKMEALAWLHDWQKCNSRSVASHWRRSKNVDKAKVDSWMNGDVKPVQELGLLLKGTPLTVNGNSVLMSELIEFGRHPRKAMRSPLWVVKMLGRAHDIAHIEKELREDESRELATDWLSTPFGYEYVQPGELTHHLSVVHGALSSLLKDPLAERDSFVRSMQVWKEAWADTRRPINEVTLWEWSSVVAALYKAELARCVLTGQQRNPDQAMWRLLAIRFDGLGYLLDSPALPDLLARREMMDDALDRVRRLLETLCPIGVEVYRDCNGSLFVVPDIRDIEDSLVRGGETLREIILREFSSGTVRADAHLRIGQEVVPLVCSDVLPWSGRGDTGLPPIGRHLSKPTHLVSDCSVSDNWGRGPHDVDACIVCGLCPTGSSRKATKRGVCDVCEKRRADRSEEWVHSKFNGTIWLDEVADGNGRLALVVGRFWLERWLDGTLVRTLAVRDPSQSHRKTASEVARNPSFARLRRIWETVRKFWRDIADPDDGTANTVASRVVGTRPVRLAIRLKGLRSSNLGPYHVYSMVVTSGVRMSVVWDGTENFITADNLLYLSRRLASEQIDDYQNAARRIESLLQGRRVTLEEPAGFGATNRIIGEFAVEIITPMKESSYVPAVPVMAEPETFMVLVPADNALNLAKEIKTKYEQEMGKVLDRLPLHIGIVYAGRKTTLRAILDAGKQMLQQTSKASGWQVKSISKIAQTGQGNMFAKTCEILLEREGRQTTWRVPVLMGDGKTEDYYYPYVFIEGNEPKSRQYYFETDNPWETGNSWVVHASELQNGDIVYFTPATFDFEFLDSASRRFSINYDSEGRRTTRLTRPYYLSDLSRLDSLWEIMKKLSKTQRYQVVGTIEETRERWFGPSISESAKDATFRRFVEATLAGAEWPNNASWETIGTDQQEQLVEAGVRGELADLLELHMRILKE